MMNSQNQILESFVPVYDVVPNEWEEAREFLVEQLKKISNALNIREIGWFLDEELISGKQFIPGTDTQEYRTILRKVIDVSPLVVGANTFAHGITIDANYTLINSWVSATDSVAFTSITMVSPEVSIDATNININSPAAYDRAYAFIEYIQEL